MATRITIHPLSSPANSADRIPDDPAMASRLRRSFAVIQARADEVADRFYRSLFQAHPALRAMFPTDLTRQRALLMQTLQWVVTHLHDRHGLHEAITALGRRHAGYGARAEHYAPVVALLVQSMAAIAGTAWSVDDADDWQTALTLIATTMQSAGPAKPGHQTPPGK